MTRLAVVLAVTLAACDSSQVKVPPELFQNYQLSLITAYDAGASYSVGDTVQHNGSSYVAKAAG